MADVTANPTAVQPVNSDTALNAPNPMLIQYAVKLGLDADDAERVITGLKASNPNISDATIGLALKQYTSQPQTQLQQGMGKEAADNNALQTPDQVKQTYNPAVGQQVADYYKNTPSALNAAVAAQGDIRGGQPQGGINTTNNNANFQRGLDQITQPAAISQDIQTKQTAALNDNSAHTQTFLDNLNKNVGTQVQFSNLDPTSALSKMKVQWAIDNKFITPQQAQQGNFSGAMLDMALQSSKTYQDMANAASKAQSERITANAAGTTANTNAEKLRYMETQEPNAKYQNTTATTGQPAATTAPNAVDEGIKLPKGAKTFNGDTLVDNPLYTKATDSGNKERDASVDQLRSINQNLQNIATARSLMKDVYIGPGSKLFTYFNGKAQALDAAFTQLGLDKMAQNAKNIGGVAELRSTNIDTKMMNNAPNMAQQRVAAKLILNNLEKVYNTSKDYNTRKLQYIDGPGKGTVIGFPIDEGNASTSSTQPATATKHINFGDLK